MAKQKKDQAAASPERIPSGFTRAEWEALDPLFKEYEGPPPDTRHVSGKPYGWAVTNYKSEAARTESIVVLDLTADQKSTFASRAMGTRCLVRTVAGTGAQHARMTQGVLGSNHFDINPAWIRDPLHRSALGGYQALADREVQKTGNLELLKNHDEDGRRVKYVIQTEYSNSINSTLREMKVEDPSKEMAKAVDDVSSWLVDEMRYNPPT